MASSTKPVLTKNRTPDRLLRFYLASLVSRPLLTKSCTSASLSFLQEILASRIAGTRLDVVPTGLTILDRVQSLGIDARALKLTAYGGLISAPLSHLLIKLLHRSFPNHQSSAKSKLGMILTSTLIIAPIQNSVFLAAMAVINGAKSVKEVQSFWKRAIGTMTKVSWIVGPASTIFANRFLAPELWVPFFNLIGFVLGTYFNQLAKKKRLRLEKLKRDPPKKKGPKQSEIDGSDKEADR